MACSGRQDDLIYNLFRILWVFLQVEVQHLAHHRAHNAVHLAVAQLRLGLSFELRLGHFHRDDGSETLAEVVARNFYLLLLYLLQHLVIHRITLQRGGQGTTETRQVRTTFDGVDVVDVGMDVL